MTGVLEAFLAEAGGGLRALVVTVAAGRLGKAFSLFENVSSQWLNEAASLSDTPGYVMCMDSNGNIILAVAVKERALPLSDVRSSTQTASASTDPLSNFFASPRLREDEGDPIRESMETA